MASSSRSRRPSRLARKLSAQKSAPTHANTIGICWKFVEIRRGLRCRAMEVVDLACAHAWETINKSGEPSAGRNWKLRESNLGARMAHRIGKVRGASHELLIPERNRSANADTQIRRGWAARRAVRHGVRGAAAPGAGADVGAGRCRADARRGSGRFGCGESIAGRSGAAGANAAAVDDAAAGSRFRRRSDDGGGVAGDDPGFEYEIGGGAGGLEGGQRRGAGAENWGGG